MKYPTRTASVRQPFKKLTMFERTDIEREPYFEGIEMKHYDTSKPPLIIK